MKYMVTDKDSQIELVFNVADPRQACAEFKRVADLAPEWVGTVDRDGAMDNPRLVIGLCESGDTWVLEGDDYRYTTDDCLLCKGCYARALSEIADRAGAEEFQESEA